MNGKPEVIAALNQLLTGELTAMDVYFVQSRMCDNWGYTKLSARLGHEVTDETRHADALIKRILFLGGQPDVASRAPFSAGKDVPEMLRFDLELENQVAHALNEAMALSISMDDNGTRAILEVMLRDTEDDHIYWLESQLHLIGDVGVQNYLQMQM